MNTSSGIALQRPDHYVKYLTPQDAPSLQHLYEQCTAFFVLTNGLTPSPTAARDEFNDVPEGKTTEDLYIIGLCDRQDNLLGSISAVRHYPDPLTWWIGLMMIAPQYRGQGLGADFYHAFERWVAVQGASQLFLVVIKVNELGLKFWKKVGFKIVRTTLLRQYRAKKHEVYVLSRELSNIS